MTEPANRKHPPSNPYSKRARGKFFHNKPIADLVLDGRSREFKRKLEIIGVFKAALGEAASEPILARKIDLAAELAVVAEVTRAKFLQGDATADDTVRTARAAGVAEKALGIDHRRKPKPFNLKDHLRETAA